MSTVSTGLIAFLIISSEIYYSCYQLPVAQKAVAEADRTSVFVCD